jgi:hypothetical protein
MYDAIILIDRRIKMKACVKNSWIINCITNDFTSSFDLTH